MKQIKKTNKIDRKFVNILGIKVDSTTIDKVLTSVDEKISHNEKFYITTPNPELVLMAQENKKLKESLNSADFSIPDGIGLKVAQQKLNIIKGRVLFDELIRLAIKKNWKVFLLGGLDNEAELTAKRLKINYSGFMVEYAGGKKITPNLDKDIIYAINKYKPDLLFVALGNPAQEIFMYENLNKLNVKGMMAVGGTFRYIAGLSKLPPKWMESLGLEWVWRLVTEPYRFKRVFNAFSLFPLKVWMSKLQKN